MSLTSASRALFTFARRTTTPFTFPSAPAIRRIPLAITTTQPIRRRQPFSATATTMGEGGVHNLQQKQEFDDALSKEGSLMVLDCFATWCGPCKAISPTVVKFSEKYTDARFYKIDVDELPDVAAELGITAMPTFLLFKDGKRVAEVVGANPAALETAIAKAL